MGCFSLLQAQNSIYEQVTALIMGQYYQIFTIVTLVTACETPWLKQIFFYNLPKEAFNTLLAFFSRKI